MKTLITRAGPGTKIVCLGNIAQIDTPYLTEGSSGLTYVVDRFRGWEHGGHVMLARGERSPGWPITLPTFCKNKEYKKTGFRPVFLLKEERTFSPESVFRIPACRLSRLRQ